MISAHDNAEDAIEANRLGAGRTWAFYGVVPLTHARVTTKSAEYYAEYYMKNVALRVAREARITRAEPAPIRDTDHEASMRELINEEVRRKKYRRSKTRPEWDDRGAECLEKALSRGR